MHVRLPNSDYYIDVSKCISFEGACQRPFLAMLCRRRPARVLFSVTNRQFAGWISGELVIHFLCTLLHGSKIDRIWTVQSNQQKAVETVQGRAGQSYLPNNPGALDLGPTAELCL